MSSDEIRATVIAVAEQVVQEAVDRGEVGLGTAIRVLLVLERETEEVVA